jgi:hypothetical protein
MSLVIGQLPSLREIKRKPNHPESRSEGLAVATGADEHHTGQKTGCGTA